MNSFIRGLIFVFLLAKVDSLIIPDYAMFFQDSEALDENVGFDDSTDLFADQPTRNGECLSYDDSDDLFSSNVVRVRPRNTCTDPAAPPLPPYTDIYNTNDIFNLLSPSPAPAPTIPGTEKKDSSVLDLERLLELPSFDPTPKTTTDNDDICPEEYFGTSRIPVCDTGDFIRDAECPPNSPYFTIYGVRFCRFNPSRFWKS